MGWLLNHTWKHHALGNKEVTRQLAEISHPLGFSRQRERFFAQFHILAGVEIIPCPTSPVMTGQCQKCVEGDYSEGRQGSPLSLLLHIMQITLPRYFRFFWEKCEEYCPAVHWLALKDPASVLQLSVAGVRCGGGAPTSQNATTALEEAPDWKGTGTEPSFSTQRASLQTCSL